MMPFPKNTTITICRQVHLEAARLAEADGLPAVVRREAVGFQAHARGASFSDPATTDSHQLQLAAARARPENANQGSCLPANRRPLLRFEIGENNGSLLEEEIDACVETEGKMQALEASAQLLLDSVGFLKKKREVEVFKEGAGKKLRVHTGGRIFFQNYYWTRPGFAAQVGRRVWYCTPRYEARLLPLYAFPTRIRL